MGVIMRIMEFLLVPVALLSQGLGVNTPMLFNFLPDYRSIFRRLWERHKNPVSWVCRPFFGLLIGYGAILHNGMIIVIGVIGLGTSWFWFPKWKGTPKWAEEFINKEFDVLTPANAWDFKRVILPSALPLALAGFYALLWFLSYPWNWLGISVIILLTIVKVIWSAKLEGTVLNPLTRIVLIGFGLGVVAGILLFLSSRIAV